MSLMAANSTAPLYGLMAEFDEVTTLVEAAKRARAEGYKKVDAYTPFPVHELFDALDAHDKRVPFLILCGGITGALVGFGLCYWVSAIAYPMNVGGRPLNSWPSFIPVTFEVTILLASLTAVVSWIGLSGLPMPYHPVFNVARFAQIASQEGLFLTIEAADPKFDRKQTFDFLKSLGAREINEVES
jgi:ActD protein